MTPNLLVLGGTTEASELASALHARGVRGTYSYAGRVARPKRQPLATRVGGFGGVPGLVKWLSDNEISHVVDATHPFAAQMSQNAIAACDQLGLPLAALTRPPWHPTTGDNWITVPDMDAAVQALAGDARRVMLAIGRMHLQDFTGLPQHFYLLRLIDAPTEPLSFPRHEVVIGQGPFSRDDDRALMQAHEIDLLVSKNAGGAAARAKIDAARDLGIPVLMIERPVLPQRTQLFSVDAVLDWVDHGTTERGV